MFAKLFLAVVGSLVAAASAKPHVLAPVGPAFVTAQSSQVFARTYNGFVPFPAAVPAAVPAAIPAPVPVPLPAPTFFVPAPPTHFYYPHPVFYSPPAAVPVPAVPAVPAAPAVVAAAPVAKLVAPVAKVAKLVRPYLTTFRYRSVVA
ncbi:zyxin-like [Anopheles cruzii]|uniref:zyxin-like n=1 Tax=Anopheles cruzii TaxID=68878 RepID=UPI0022EC84BD|nr:zyxin-like [Anopheles cruzii]